jgi:hypothetical protein
MSTEVVLAQTNGASAGCLDVFILRRVAAGGRRILSGKESFGMSISLRGVVLKHRDSCTFQLS